MSCRHAQIHHADHAAAHLLPHALTHPLTCSTEMSALWHGDSVHSPRQSNRCTDEELLGDLPVVLQASMGRACRDATQQRWALNGAATWASERRGVIPLVSSFKWTLVGALLLCIPAQALLSSGAHSSRCCSKECNECILSLHCWTSAAHALHIVEFTLLWHPQLACFHVMRGPVILASASARALQL